MGNGGGPWGIGGGWNWGGGLTEPGMGGWGIWGGGGCWKSWGGWIGGGGWIAGGGGCCGAGGGPPSIFRRDGPPCKLELSHLGCSGEVLMSLAGMSRPDAACSRKKSSPPFMRNQLFCNVRRSRPSYTAVAAMGFGGPGGGGGGAGAAWGGAHPGCEDASQGLPAAC